MISRAASFYLGVWLPVATCWIIVVLAAAAFMKDAAIGIGLTAAIGGPLAAILLGAQISREEKKGSWKFVIAHRELNEAELLRLGLKKGVLLGPISILGVALIPVTIFAADHILTALGK